MSNDNSDYDKVRTNIYDLLPQVLRSDVNQAAFENLQNRFLTKQEIEKVAGYIGEGNDSAIVKRQIIEPTVHRQAFQLQPIVYNKIGSVEHMAAWYDLLNELERLGVDTERLSTWGCVQEFNWAPPVDFDKLVNYQDYYWYDTDNPSSLPQYLTIRSRCTTATANANFWINLTDEFGLTIPIQTISPVDATLPSYSVETLDSGTQYVTVSGNATDELSVGETINITGTASNDGEHVAITPPVYSALLNETSFKVNGTIVASETSVGLVNLQRFDKLVINGEYVRLFDSGFVFFFTNSTNTDLNNSFWQVASSEYNESTNKTTVTLTSYVTASEGDGVVSNEEQLSFYLAERDCQCSGSVGWDLLQWDDNIDSPLWGGVAPGDHAALMTAISNPAPPMAAGTDGELWFDTVADTLFQYNSTTMVWKALWNNFSIIVAQTEGFALWDYTPGCEDSSRVKSADQWIEQNNWFHKSDIPNFSIAKQAAYPIIEYDWDLELNEWASMDTVWDYRKNKFNDWETITGKPTQIELQPLEWWETDVPNDEIVLDERYGDLTGYFTPGTTFRATNTVEYYEVDYSHYSSPVADQPFNTRIKLTTTVASTPLISGDFAVNRPSTTSFHPSVTSQGDPWAEYGDQWMFVEWSSTVPIPHLPVNPFAQIDETASPVLDVSGDFESITTYATQQFSLLVPGVTVFDLNTIVLPGTLRSMRRRALVGYNDVRVYINDIRQYGNYDELDEDIVSIIGVTANTWTVSSDVSSHVSPGDVISVDANTGGASGTYTVLSVAADVITVTAPILGTATATGNLSNVTVPMSGVTSPYRTFVRGIEFIAGVNAQKFDEIRIEVGESTVSELGRYAVPVRLDADNADFMNNGPTEISLIKSRQTEQVKSIVNQYPLFDIYNTDGTPANLANPIFGYQTSPDADVVAGIGQRIVIDSTSGVVSFDQFILSEDDGTLYAYRDYSNEVNDFWYNPITGELKFWDNFSWSDSTTMDTSYGPGLVSSLEPDPFYLQINGYFWFDTTTNTLKRRNVSTNSWNVVPGVDIVDHDVTLQTIWKKGLNSEEYCPSKVDWDVRTLEEYNAERELYVEQRAQELQAASPLLTDADAIELADAEWLVSQINPHSATGEWIGDWEIPDPLYFNNQHENRKHLSGTELLAHFSSIIEAQPKIPGYNGPKESMFHLIPTGNVNYGLGGTIKEFNDGFDTFVSSIFINNVTPIRLIDFAHDQYEALLNSLKESYRKNAVDLLSSLTPASINSTSEVVTESLILAHELNDNVAFLYGDSTTFTDVAGADDTGIRNWIATLPYIQTLFKVLPRKIVDEQLDLLQIVHHDGHRNAYELVQPLVESIINTVNNSDDIRTKPSGPTSPAEDTLGRLSNDLPPNSIAEFNSEFITEIDGRQGVYWYTVNGPDRVWYRLILADVSTTTPATDFPDGTLWMDITSSAEVLRVKQTNPITSVITWAVVPGLSIGDGRLHNGTDPSDLTTALVSAWQPVDINEYLNDAVLEVENRLYENAPQPPELAYDPLELRATDPVLFDQYLNRQFLDYAATSEITTPFANSVYAPSDPFTWNYKYSTPGAGIEILFADSVTDSFVVPGDVRTLFDQCASFNICPSQVTFYLKNSGVNDGTWQTTLSTMLVPSVVYDAGEDESTIFVEGSVSDSVSGVIYAGILPSSANTGSESGGDWRDYYEKVYGTPYPHLEPWVLQGYTDEPAWWSEQYNNIIPDKWGVRRWNYKHGFDVTGVDIFADAFEVTGDFREAFAPISTFAIDGSVGVHDGSYDVDALAFIAGVNVGLPGVGSIEIVGDVTSTFTSGLGIVVASAAGEIQDVVSVAASYFSLGLTYVVLHQPITTATDWDIIGGATFDVTSNTTTIRVLQNLTVVTPSGRITKAFGMWENIRAGEIPPGTTYSNGVISISGNPTMDNAVYGLQTPSIPTYNYMSVNINNIPSSSDGGTTEYLPDQVFPPYWDFSPQYTSAPVPFDRTIRSLFYSFGSEIVAPGADYAFGDSGNTEWEWRQTSQYLYDLSTVAFRMDPIRYVAQTFGVEFGLVNELQIDQRTNNTFSHTRSPFHGDIVGDQPYLANGTNQWYVNFNRYAGYDATWSDFRSLWTLWTAPMMYQFASFVDTPSLSTSHRIVPVSKFDYEVAAKKSIGVEDTWLDAFDVTVTNIPPAINRYDNQLEWEFEVVTNLPSSRTIDYYDVHNYQFYPDPVTDICTLYKWDIVYADSYNDVIHVVGDQSTVFDAGRSVTIAGSTGNDGTYTTISSVYNAVDNKTIIELSGDDVSSVVIDGTIQADYRSMPWETGDVVVLSTAQTMPAPLETDNVNGVYQYMVIKVDDTSFRLALTPNDAQIGTYVDIINKGTGDVFVGQIRGTFTARDGQFSSTDWRRYAIDKSNLLSLTTPHEVKGMQTLVDVVFGYDAVLADNGWSINKELSEIDPETNEAVTWQVELERFIDYAYRSRNKKVQVTERYETTVDETSDVWTFVDESAHFVTGDKVTVLSSNTVYPTPIVRGLSYYVIRDSISKFQLAATRQDAEQGIEIDITVPNGMGTLWITTINAARGDIPRQEINPFRNAVWYAPERGIVSNIITGPAEDVRTTQLIFDQYGRGIRFDDLHVLRLDKVTQVRYDAEVDNDVELTSVYNDPYNYLHMGGMHIFIDAYEHVLRFNNYTSQGNLLYDPFIGLNLTKFEMLFNRQVDFTQRPNVGGYYLETFFNQGAELKQNIEASIDALRYLYDTYQVLESDVMVGEGRRGLGYEGTTDYLDNLNLNQKSQFVFWRGMIQYKGAVNAMNAFVNSRRFIEAYVDEFWAVKIAEYGSVGEKEYPEMFVNTVDARANDMRLQFVREADFCLAGFDNNPYSNENCGFAFPEDGDAQLLVDEGFIPVAISDEDRWYKQPDQFDELKNNGEGMYFELKANMQMDVDANTDLEYDNEGNYVIRHNFATDYIVAVVDLYAGGAFKDSVTGVTGTNITVTPYIPFTESIKVFKNGTLMDIGTDYTEILEVGDTLTSDTLLLTVSLLVTDTIDIVYTAGQLVEDVHFEQVNANIVRLLVPALVDDSPHYDTFTLWGMVLDKESQNPARLIDIKSNVLARNVQYWDPARNYHHQPSIHNVDLQRDADPAIYGVTPIGSQFGATDPGAKYPVSWNKTEVGTTWMDTSLLSYVPYYDEQAFTSLDERLRVWGQLSDWAEVNLHEWVESDVPPSEWDELAAAEEGDVTIDESIRKSGTAHQVYFHADLDNLLNVTAVNTTTNTVTVFGLMDETVNWIGKTLWWKFSTENDGTYVVSALEYTTTHTIITFVDLIEDATVNGNISPSIRTVEINNVVMDAVVEGTITAEGYSFEVPVYPASPGVLPGSFDVYVNGVLHTTDVPTTGNPTVFNVGGVKEADRVEFAQKTDSETVEALIEAGNVIADYEYTAVPSVGALGEDVTTYYFWVTDKSTKASKKNRTAPISEVTNTLTAIPDPYIFFLKPIAEETVEDVASSLHRTETHEVDSSLEVAVDLLVVNVLSVTIDDVAYPYTWSGAGSTITIATSSPGDVAVVRYVGAYTPTIELPVRFVEAVVRGIRGLVDADRRYVLRYTRDFTLRDSLEFGDSPLNLKSLHEEWEIFREQQQYHVNRWQWDRVTEALIGYKVDDMSIRVPSFERELYDSKYDSDTRFGLGEGQAFTDGELSLQTIIADLVNPNNEFYPVDINIFFERESFDTPENIEHAMNTIYNTFAYEHVNRIYFSVLQDALTVKLEYADLIKTSMIALHGVRPFQVGGIFDD